MKLYWYHCLLSFILGAVLMGVVCWYFIKKRIEKQIEKQMQLAKSLFEKDAGKDKLDHISKMFANRFPKDGKQNFPVNNLSQKDINMIMSQAEKLMEELDKKDKKGDKQR